jgi:hypothetical protein
LDEANKKKQTNKFGGNKRYISVLKIIKYIIR